MQVNAGRDICHAYVRKKAVCPKCGGCVMVKAVESITRVKPVEVACPECGSGFPDITARLSTT